MTPTLRSMLTGLAGVWEGQYTHLAPDGTPIGVLASRQETRLEGNVWYERIRYRAPGREDEVLDFRAHFTGDDDLRFADEAIEGRSILIDAEHLLFPYRWRDQPGSGVGAVHVVELITLLDTNHRTRLWQRFSGNVLEQLTVITEQRRPDQTPEVWK